MRLPPATPSIRTLKKRISSDRVEFENEDWAESFERYVRASRKIRYLVDRLVFANKWMLIMQEQMCRGVLDPQVAYERTKRITHIRPHLSEAIFIRGLVVSHWKYGLDFIETSSDYMPLSERKKEIEDLKRRYYFSEISENESKRKTLF